MRHQASFDAPPNVGLNLEQAVKKAGLTIVNPEAERGCWTSVWVNGKLVRCYVRAPR